MSTREPEPAAACAARCLNDRARHLLGLTLVTAAIDELALLARRALDLLR